MRKKTNKVKNILKPITRDTRINPESNCTPTLHTGTTTKKMQNEPNLTKYERKHSTTKDLRKYLHPASDIQIRQSNRSEDPGEAGNKHNSETIIEPKAKSEPVPGRRAGAGAPKI